METILDFIEASKRRTFLICFLASMGIHAIILASLLPFGAGKTDVAGPSGLAERFTQAVNTATDINSDWQKRADEILSGIQAKEWNRSEMANTLRHAAKKLNLPVMDSDVLRALDPERSREDRWDIRIWLSWEKGRDAADLLALAYLVGEGSLRSDFGSHRLWIHLEAEDGSGRAALETMDCRNYKTGKINASDLLHKHNWLQP